MSPYKSKQTALPAAPAKPTLFAGAIVVALAAMFLLLPHGASATTPAELNGRIEALSEQMHQLEGRINKLQGNQDAAQAELSRQTAREQQLAGQLAASRKRLAKLKRDLAHSKKVLSERIVAIYKGGEPNVLSIVLESGGFAQMVERATYLQRVAHQDQTTIDRVKTLKKSTTTETVRLAGLQSEARQLVAQVQTKRDRIATAKGKVVAEAGGLRTTLAKQRRILRAMTATVTAQPAAPTQGQFRTVSRTDGSGSGRVTLNSDGSASAPANAPSAIKAAVAAGNQIRSTPYIWGGGHGSFSDKGYDCSGSVSYVLHAAGVLGSPMASGPLMGWGAPGPGNWITVYANSGHAWMTVGGLRFDTSGRSGTGSRWQNGMDGGGGFTVRHYPGL